MKVKVKVPRLGLTVEEAIVMEWHKQVGDTVEAGEVIGVIEADKATVELESPATGTLTEIIGEIGETYEIGEPLAVLEV
ncbi:MAG: biotin attachment protein [Rhodospirillaceae bacterium]|mgnify:FL=1|nr:biotin attachment protein [Rhodospirillaceae bacterium]